VPRGHRRALTMFEGLIARHDSEEISDLAYLVGCHIQQLREIRDHVNDSWEEARIAWENGRQKGDGAE
jgi:hypothetical protein